MKPGQRQKPQGIPVPHASQIPRADIANRMLSAGLPTSEQTLLMEHSLPRLAIPDCHVRSVILAVLVWNLNPWEHLQSTKLTNVNTQVLLLSFRAKERHSQPSSGLTLVLIRPSPCDQRPILNARPQLSFPGSSPLPSSAPGVHSPGSWSSNDFCAFLPPGPLLKLSVLTGSRSLRQLRCPKPGQDILG